MHVEPWLEGPRVLLRMAREGDAPAIVAFLERNRAHFRPWDPIRPSEYYTGAWWVERARQLRIELEQDRSCHMWVFHRAVPGRVLGFVNLSNVTRGAMHGCTVGYGIDVDAAGQGLMREALELGVRYAFDVLRLHRVAAGYVPTNERSGRLLKRMGFVVEGYARDYLFINGEWRDHVLTALVNPALSGGPDLGTGPRP